MDEKRRARPKRRKARYDKLWWTLVVCVVAAVGNIVSFPEAGSQPKHTPEPTAVVTAMPEPVAHLLVYAAGSGARYHIDMACSGMKSPIAMTLEEAIAKGYTPCKRCEPPTLAEP